MFILIFLSIHFWHNYISCLEQFPVNMHNYFKYLHNNPEVINLDKRQVQKEKTPGRSDNKQNKSKKKQDKPDDI